MPDGARCHRVIVALQTHVFGLARMFQILVENTRPLLSVVHTLDEAFAGLGVQSPLRTFAVTSMSIGALRGYEFWQARCRSTTNIALGGRGAFVGQSPTVRIGRPRSAQFTIKVQF